MSKVQNASLARCDAGAFIVEHAADERGERAEIGTEKSPASSMARRPVAGHGFDLVSLSEKLIRPVTSPPPFIWKP